MTSLVDDILKATLESQLKIEDAILSEICKSHSAGDSPSKVAIIMTATKIEEIRKQLAILNNKSNG